MRFVDGSSKEHGATGIRGRLKGCLYCLGALVVLLAIGAGFYCCFLFAPTGFEPVEARHRGAVDRMDQMLRLASDAAASAPGTAQASSVSSPASSVLASTQPRASEKAFPFLQTVLASEATSRAAATADFATQALAITNGFGKIQTVLRPFISSDLTRLHSCRAGWVVEEEVSSITLTAALRGPALDERIRNEVAWTEEREKRGREPDQALAFGDPESARLLGKLNALLDQTEALLLSAWKFPPFQDFSQYYSDWVIAELSNLATLRARARGDFDKAGRLFERSSKAAVATYLMDPNSWFGVAGVGALASRIAEMDGFPTERLLAVEKLVQRSRMDDKQLADLRVAYILRARSRAVHAIKTGQFRSTENWLHWLYGGAIDGMLQRAAAPALIRQVDSLTPALLAGDAQWIKSQWAQAEQLGKALNLDTGSSFWELAYLSDAKQISFQRDFRSSRDRYDLSLLAVATALYRLRHEAYPQTVSDLAPECVSLAFDAQTGDAWFLCALGDGQLPAFCHLAGEWTPSNFQGHAKDILTEDERAIIARAKTKGSKSVRMLEWAVFYYVPSENTDRLVDLLVRAPSNKGN